MSKLFTTAFVEDNVPQTGLSVTIRIRDLADNSLVVTDAACTEIGDGGYVYDYVDYDSTKNYQFRFDGGVTLYNRYNYGWTQPDQFAISDAVWDEFTSEHKKEGTFGNDLATKADVRATASTFFHTASSGTILQGDLSGGVYTNTFVRDNIFWTITENTTNGLDVEFQFNLPDNTHRAGAFKVFGHYDGKGTNHYMDMWIYNVEGSAWELLHQNFMTDRTTDEEQTHNYEEHHIDRDNNNLIRVRLIHNVTPYDNTHILNMDYVCLSSIKVITAAEIADAVWEEDSDEHTTPGTTGYLQKLKGLPKAKFD